MARQRSETHPAARNPRPPRRVHRETAPKRSAATVCPGCGARYGKGRWSWDEVPASSKALECPSCERIREDYPAGVLRLSGAFLAKHRQEITGRLRHVEERERRTHPLKRIMDIRNEGDEVVVRVTDGKLIEALGHALTSAYRGTLELPRTTSERENLVRASWSRD